MQLQACQPQLETHPKPRFCLLYYSKKQCSQHLAAETYHKTFEWETNKTNSMIPMKENGQHIEHNAKQNTN